MNGWQLNEISLPQAQWIVRRGLGYSLTAVLLVVVEEERMDETSSMVVVASFFSTSIGVSFEGGGEKPRQSLRRALRRPILGD